jgi:Trk-type K+ transport system membrane component
VWLLRLLDVLGSNTDILIQWLSAISLILGGLFFGVLISEKKIQVRKMSVVQFLLFALGFLAAPLVAVGAVMLTETYASSGVIPVVAGAVVVAYLLLYMRLWFWLKKNKHTFESTGDR